MKRPVVKAKLKRSGTTVGTNIHTICPRRLVHFYRGSIMLCLLDKNSWTCSIYIQGWALGRSVITQKDEKREKKVFNIFTWVK